MASVAVETPPPIPQTSTHLEVDGVGKGIDLRSGNRDQLGVRAVGMLADDGDLAVAEIVTRVDDDPVARCETVSRDHDAGAVGAEDARLRHRGEAFADPDVQMIERGGTQFDQDLSGAWHRIGGVFVAKHLRSAVLVDTHGLHGAQSRT